MSEEKLKTVLEYFSDNDIEIPTDVKNAIEDVFSENDTIDGVTCYHVEDAEEFENDLTLKNKVELFLDGKNKGETNNIWTYYGEINYILSEETVLYKEDGTVEEKITDINYSEKTSLNDLTEWAVVLHEKLSWDTSVGRESKRELSLRIFCPIVGDPDIYNEDEYERLYQELTGEASEK